jgi:hypothetical protein
MKKRRKLEKGHIEKELAKLDAQILAPFYDEVQKRWRVMAGGKVASARLRGYPQGTRDRVSPAVSAMNLHSE